MSGAGLRPATPIRRTAKLVALTAVAVSIAGCGGSTTTVMRPPVQVWVASGDAQYGTSGQTLDFPLKALVQALTTDLPQPGVEVLWSIESGDAEIVGVPATISDSTGIATASVRLGASVGPVVVRATAQGQSPAFAEFDVFLVDRPVVSSLSSASALPGESLVLSGRNFVPDPAQNVVLFSGIRGEVTGSTPTSLTVTVPPCLPEREVDVSVQLGAVASGSLGLSIGPGGSVSSLQVGDVEDDFDPAGLACITLPGSGGASYVVQLHSTSRAGAATHPWTLAGLGSESPIVPAARAPAHRERVRRPPESDVGAIWDAALREQEEILTLRRRRMRATEGGDVAAVAPQPVPQVNDVREFNVYQGPGDFVEVTAVARYVGEHAALFVDVDAPAGGYTQDDLRAFSDEFDDVIWPVVDGAFGTSSDLDGNERIVILFTPAVNALTPRDAMGLVAGFFYGGDLLPEVTGSNSGEVFYALVPDPNGVYSDPRPRDDVRALTPAVLAHEYQHMVHFNQRVLVRGAEANEAVWMLEALAQFAEELVAREYTDRGDDGNAERFRTGVRERARRYLSATDDVSLVIASGSGSLEERGASYLYLTYLTDRYGVDLAGRLTRTTRTGVRNVSAETGDEWASGLSDWWSALVLDGPGPESGPLVYPTIDLRGYLGAPYPLEPSPLGGADFERSGTLRSASARYYIVNPLETGSVTLRLGGEGGGARPPQAGLRMRVIRVQ